MPSAAATAASIAGLSIALPTRACDAASANSGVSPTLVSATAALYLNLFVLVVQSFLKVPALNALAPNGTEPPFVVAQAALLLAAIAFGYVAIRSSLRLAV